jgi:ferredoxin-type protein NapH
MTVLSNLSVLRKLVQLAAFAFLVYGSTVTGYYLADKLSNALPALSCAYDFQNADYCALIPFQHQMAHRVGPAVASGGALLPALLPSLFTLATFLVLFVLLNKAFCGWICPLGLFQELLAMLGQKLGLNQRAALSEPAVQRLRPLKWVLLGGLVFGLPLLSGLGFVSHDWVGAFCGICPSRLLTTLATGSTEQLRVDSASTTLIALSVTGDFLFGALVGLGLTLKQPFCRICPMLALHAAFRRLGLLRLVKQATPRCQRCGLCAQACPMDIREIHQEQTRQDLTFADCTLCGRCVEFCPDRDALHLRYLGFPVFRSDPNYFKARKRAQQRWERWRLGRSGPARTAGGAAE